MKTSKNVLAIEQENAFLARLHEAAMIRAHYGERAVKVFYSRFPVLPEELTEREAIIHAAI